MGVIRLFFMAFVVLSVFYISLSLYSRAVRKGKLELDWIEDGREGDKDAYVKAGLVDYDSSLRRRLILGVYVIPMVIVGTILYFVNYT